ncbi:phage tail protein [Campylobacter suis]|uniref:Phage tail fibre protein N-terminal domain-containing protein n=1 Tax=Campylobacter suis TaxID=2790657 RepID=A0ABN7KBB2_9BACT|nr:phage tail protein [Campylobacter suis]CAD7288205.1 hypothetical protein LMG8286_01190 [Campylobacter suis]
MKYFSILTTIGLNKLIKATANNEQIILSKMSVSDDSAEISQDMQSLQNERHKFSINSITQSESDKNVLICEGVITSDVGGFYIRKVGIYTDTDELFAVGEIPQSYKPLMAEGSAKDITIKFYLQIDNGTNITLKVDNNVVLATRNYVKDEIKKLNTELYTKFLPIKGKAADSTLLNGREASEYLLKNELSQEIQIATETKAGITKLKNTISGNAEDTAVTEKAVKDYVDVNASIGVNQTWQDMTEERQANITYTNTTGRPIAVIIYGKGTPEVSIGGNHIIDNFLGNDPVGHNSIFFLVPVGASYIASNHNKIVKWLELR